MPTIPADELARLIAERDALAERVQKLERALIELLPHAEAGILREPNVYPAAVAKLVNAKALLAAPSAPKEGT